MIAQNPLAAPGPNCDEETHESEWERIELAKDGKNIGKKLVLTRSFLGQKAIYYFLSAKR